MKTDNLFCKKLEKLINSKNELEVEHPGGVDKDYSWMATVNGGLNWCYGPTLQQCLESLVSVYEKQLLEGKGKRKGK